MISMIIIIVTVIIHETSLSRFTDYLSKYYFSIQFQIKKTNDMILKSLLSTFYVLSIHNIHINEVVLRKIL